MKALDNVCLRIAGDFKQLETEIATLEADLESFENCAARYHVEQLELRLQTVHMRIKIKVAEQYIEHNNQGSVCIMMLNGTIGFAWFEQEPILDDASKLRIKPMTALPVEEFFALIKNLLQELHDGNWEPAVNWLNTKAVWLNTGEHL